MNRLRINKISHSSNLNQAISKSVAIDGPTASGKTTLGRGLADELKIGFFDTGLMYRAATLSILKNNINLLNEQKIIDHINDIKLEVIWEVFSQPEIKIDEINITSQLRDKAIEDNVSIISKIPEVRSFMVDYQRNHAKQSPIVMAGRDIGTRVLIESKVKFFLHASPEIRASRRLDELKASGDMRSFEEVLQQTKKRDSLDQTGKRAIQIEQAATDAQVIRTENLSINELIKHCSKIYNELIEK